MILIPTLQSTSPTLGEYSCSLPSVLPMSGDGNWGCCPLVSSLLQWEWCSPGWASSLPPEWSWSRAALHCCVWPVGASPQTGRLAGRWRAAAGLGGCQIVWGSWGKMATTAGAAPWPSLQTSGGRRAQWAVRPVRVARRLSLKPWILASVQSREAPAWKYCRIQISSDTSASYLSV